MLQAFFRNIESGKILFKRFQMVSCLSARGDSGVYLCQDIENDNREVALKIVSCGIEADPDLMSRFRNEMAVSSKILHPNVLHGEEFFEDESFAAFSMDYTAGGSLADLLNRQEPLPLEELLDIARQLCEALQAIHDAGILHRDLKPENILINQSGKIQISDFGISLMGNSVKTSRDSGLFGTINYLSPEYIQDGRFDRRSDIYALGLILYELLTGRLPFSESAPLKVLLERVQKDPEPALSFSPRAPKKLNAIIMRAIARNPDRRYQSANDMLKDILEFAGSKTCVQKSRLCADQLSLTETGLKNYDELKLQI